jgi:hypothetical protein
MLFYDRETEIENLSKIEEDSNSGHGFKQLTG